jgi:hypothetical protein
MTSKLLALLLLMTGLSAAQAQPFFVNGNDTGGIIPWSHENERVAFAAATNHCGWYGKNARITSVYRKYGQYIGFSCAFPRGYIARTGALRVRG